MPLRLSPVRILAPVALLAVAAAILARPAPPASAGPAITASTVEYKAGDVACEGLFARDPEAKGKVPGVLVVHDWMGVGPFVKDKVQQLAAMGYAAFAADVYGKGVRPANPAEAGQQAGKYKGDRALLRSRVRAALDTLVAAEGVDPARIVVMGYCFGGTAAIELARSGAPVAGVVSFHGGLDSPTPADGKNIQGKVLALHGADDPFVQPKDVAAFEDELRQAKVDWQLIAYGGAVHAFTNPAAGNDNSKGAAYNAAADRRSWEAFKTFLTEVFGAPPK